MRSYGIISSDLIQQKSPTYKSGVMSDENFSNSESSNLLLIQVRPPADVRDFEGS